MAYPSYSKTLTNGTTANASDVSTDFTDILNGITDGTKDININALSAVTGTITTLTSATAIVSGEAKGDRMVLPIGAIITGNNQFIGVGSSTTSARHSFTMNRPGSIVGLSLTWYISAFTGAGSFVASVRQNDTTNFISSSAQSVVNVGSVGSYTTTVARGVSTFIAGDFIGLKITTFSGTYSADIQGYIEIQLDT